MSRDRWASRWPEGSASDSKLAELDSLIEKGERYLKKPSPVVTVRGDLEDSLRKPSLYLLDAFGPNYHKLRGAVDGLRFPLSARTQPGQLLPLTKQRSAYRVLRKLVRVLKQARRLYVGPSSLRARRQHRENALKELIRAVKRERPELSQRELCGKVDDICARDNLPLPMPRTWKKEGAKNLLTAFENLKLRPRVQSYLSKIVPASP
jgi:hypothetical protein